MYQTSILSLPLAHPFCSTFLSFSLKCNGHSVWLFNMWRGGGRINPFILMVDWMFSPKYKLWQNLTMWYSFGFKNLLVHSSLLYQTTVLKVPQTTRHLINIISKRQTTFSAIWWGGRKLNIRNYGWELLVRETQRTENMSSYGKCGTNAEAI